VTTKSSSHLAGNNTSGIEKRISTNKQAVMSVRTYGDKPIQFQVEDGGEFYCIGSEVSQQFAKVDRPTFLLL
jgi:hypothetical protein